MQIHLNAFEFEVGDVVEFIVDGKTLYDTITYINGACIEGRLYDLSCIELKLFEY